MEQTQLKPIEDKEQKQEQRKFRRSTDRFIYGLFSKFCYFIFFILMFLIGGFLYLQYEVAIIKTTQQEGIKLFKLYSERDKEQQRSIIELTNRIDNLDDKIDQNYLLLSKKLDEFMRVVVENNGSKR